MEFGDSISRHLGGGATDAEAAGTREAGQRLEGRLPKAWADEL